MSDKIRNDASFIDNSVIRTTGSIALSAVTAKGSIWGLNKIKKKINAPLKANMYTEIHNRNDIYKEAVLKALKRDKIKYSDLATDPCSMFPGADKEFDELVDMQKNKFYTKLWDKINDFKSRYFPKIFKPKNAFNSMETLWAAAEGKNAITSYNKIFVNMDEIAGVAPHEAGHVKNFTTKGLGKFLQTARAPLFTKLGLGIAFASAILIPPKNKNDKEEKSILSKSLSFLKEHCVGIGVLSMLPTVMEEGFASVKGAKMMKGLLPAKEMAIMNKMNTKALLTYITSACVLTGGIYVADKVRNWTA